MRITFLALGSRGDIQPYVTLGDALLTAGHQVSFITTANYKNLIEEQGIDFYPVPGNAESLVKNSGASVLSLMWAFRNIARGLITNAKQIIPVLAETDIILNQLPGGAFGLDITEKYAVPMSLVATIPLVRTSAFPMVGWPSVLSHFPSYNKWSYQLSEQIAWYMLKPLINQWRQEVLGLSKVSTSDYFSGIRTKKVPVLNGFSKYVVPRPPDWEDHIHITGYWSTPDHGWQPSDALQKFLERDQQPIYIGFGSMPLRSPERTNRMIINALEAIGQRAVLHAGWGGLGQEVLPEYVFKIDYVPHGWLFPRMKAVVHHGGAGTTAAGLRAGVPSLIIPFLFDQFFWANRIAELGAGPDPISYRNLSSANLARGISQAVNDLELRNKSAGFGERIKAEDGVCNAIQIISMRNPVCP